MRAITVRPKTAGSAQLQDVPDPPESDGSVLAETLAIGVCGTDVEIVAGKYGWAPPGRERLVIGHESIARVVEAPPGSGLTAGDLIVGIVRRPDPDPCAYCAAGEWDMCRNGRYTERGIKERDGYASERIRVEPSFAVRVDPSLGTLGVLLEPASVVAKAWDHAEQIGRRSAAWNPRTALVTGAGPIGLLATLLGRQRGLEVHVFDRVASGTKPSLVKDAGAIYHGGELSSLGEFSPDIIIECTGATEVVADVVTRSAPSGIVCLAGLSSGGHRINLDLGSVNAHMVLENDAIFGSVNANRRHYAMAADALAKADRQWLSRLITRCVPLESFRDALERRPDDVKVIIEFPHAR
ncbi:MAG TPA: glucose 1-dehydrogenase [Vicinamibacterales bacterium]|jgi:threonine dehydrogenase-like Zn-dependent dehydrogenase